MKKINLTMKKTLLLALCMTMVMFGCKNKGKGDVAQENDVDIEAIADGDDMETEDDGVPMPMFLITADEHYRYLLYWTDVEEPEMSEDNEEWHQSWALQEQFRRNSSQYTNLLSGDKIVKVKYVDEMLTNPDGKKASVGEIHRPEIPSMCARFKVVNPRNVEEDELGRVVVTDSYLKSRKRLDVKVSYTASGEYKRLPDAVVKQLEKQYQMKASRSMLTGKIGDRYTCGAVQFAGEYKIPPRDEYDYKKSLALEVIVDGDKVYACEKLGYYDNGMQGWNADDEGEYIPCDIVAAFEGPKGVELCYDHGAPESYEVGMFFLRNGEYVQQRYEIYHTMIDEEIPVWKKDIAQMQKLFDESGVAVPDGFKLTKWAHFYIDYSNEWIWLRHKEDDTGAFFLRQNGKPTLIATILPYQTAYKTSANDIDYLIISGSLIEPTFATEAFGFKDGRQVEHFKSVEENGEIGFCELNGQNIGDDGRRYLDIFKNADKLEAYFHDSEEE